MARGYDLRYQEQYEQIQFEEEPMDDDPKTGDNLDETKSTAKVQLMRSTKKENAATTLVVPPFADNSKLNSSDQK